jgi:uncharacterized protein (DUF1778 family)
MNQTYTHVMTLRLTTETDELIAEAAYDRRITKSDFIRAAIRQSLKDHHAKTATGESR